MPRVFFGNFDFEHELAGRSPSRTVQQFASDLAATWLAVAEPGDAIVSPLHTGTESSGVRFIADLEEFRGQDFEFIPWGWTPRMADRAVTHGLAPTHPPLHVVRRVNQRAFRFALEQELGVALPGACLVESVDDLSRAISAIPPHQDWVLKAAFGMSGRERIRGRGPPADQAAGWLRNRSAQNAAFVFEPWLKTIAEAGIQFDIPRDGEPVCLGIAPQIVDRSGAYRGSRFGAAIDRDPWESAVHVGLRVARQLQVEGYFGPLGIDAMQHRVGDRIKLRPLQDLNARWTMGRLALGLRRFLRLGECGAWLHHRWSRSIGEIHGKVAELRKTLPADVRIDTLAADSRRQDAPSVPGRASVALFAPTAESRRVAELAFDAELANRP